MNELNRLKQVVQVLAKNGLAGPLAKYGFSWYLPIFKRKASPLPEDAPQKIRKSMEELGGAYIKLGQLLSIRPDLIPQEYCDEFAKLQDNVPPEPTEEIIKVIEQSFNKPLKDIFSHFDPRPLGSASVAQVHKTRLKTGQAAAVKIQRPRVAQDFQADINIIKHIAQKIQTRLTNGLNVQLIINEFERYTKKELDFTTEANRIDEIRQTLTNKNIVIPKVYWNQTTKKILTLEYLDGKKLKDTNTREKEHIINTLVDSSIGQFFEHGIFHADLHPGNILVLKNNKIGILDFGIVGHLDQKTRKLGIKLYLAILERDSKAIAETLLQYGTPTSQTNIPKFIQSINQTLEDWWDKHDRRITRLMHELFILSIKNGIIMPTDTILLGKGLVTLEATAKQLDPDFNFITYTQKDVTKILKKQKTTKTILNKFTKQTKTLAEALTIIPTKTIETLDAIKQGRVDFHLDDTKFRHLGKDINLSSNRLSYSLISAALIIAASTMMNVGPKLGSYSLISLISLMLATIFVFILLISISREGNPKYDKHNHSNI